MSSRKDKSPTRSRMTEGEVVSHYRRLGLQIPPDVLRALRKETSDLAPTGAQRAVLGVQGAPEPERPPSVESFTVTLPLPPSTNHAYTNLTYEDGTVGRKLTEEGKEFKRVAQLMVTRAATDAGWWYRKGGRLSLRYEFYFDYGRDITNNIKLTEDAVAAALGFNDRVVDYATQRRVPGRHKPPRCTVEVSYYEGSIEEEKEDGKT